MLYDGINCCDMICCI